MRNRFEFENFYFKMFENFFNDKNFDFCKIIFDFFDDIDNRIFYVELMSNCYVVCYILFKSFKRLCNVFFDRYDDFFFAFFV